MSIVAISDTLGSRGDAMGRELARRLGCEFADREVITKAAEQFGEAVGELHEVTETRPTLWERFTDSKRRYLLYVEATVFEMAARDRAGLAADPRTRSQRLTVETHDRRLTLRGFADSEGHKDAALQIVRAVPGVIDIVDETVIPSIVDAFPRP